MAEYEDINPRFLNALKIKRNVPFEKLIGIELLDVKKGWAKMRLPLSDKLLQPQGIAHGGTIMSLADTVVAMALVGICDRDETFTTVEMKINFLKPFEKDEIIAEGKIISKGKTIAVGDVDIKDPEGRLIAKSLVTYSITRRKD